MQINRKYDKLEREKGNVVNMNKKVQKIAAWFMVIIMVASVVAGLLAYIL